MDTSTHVVMGMGLAGLSQCDPVVASEPATAAAVFLGVMLGSQAPDADTVFKWKSNLLYLQQHRGISHSPPMAVVWSVLIAAVLAGVIPGASFLHVLAWSALAVVIHIISDLFNPYGTLAAWPFVNRWICWNIIALFDPFIFSTHLAAIALWVTKLVSPRIVFPILYSVLVLYCIWRIHAHRRVVQGLPNRDPEFAEGESYTVMPTVAFSRWNVVKRRRDGTFRLGHWKRGTVAWTETARCSDHPLVEASRSHPAVQALLDTSRFVCATLEPTRYGYAVRWADVRYRHRKQFPLVALVMMNKEGDIFDYFVGWLNKPGSARRYGLEWERS
ncbi:metal-dependent hydrolase [Paenibacillus thiaminolyticus]|nr:metal-dependent hydrolase [Paenibacillus thiaminolyticus]